METHCVICGAAICAERWSIGYRTCMTCGEEQARSVKHTIVPMPKSNYILVTDLALLQNLNSSHRGNR